MAVHSQTQGEGYFISTVHMAAACVYVSGPLISTENECLTVAGEPFSLEKELPQRSAMWNETN